MGTIKLELRFPHRIDGITADPEPHWNFDEFISELSAVEAKLNASSTIPVPYTKASSRNMSGAKSIAIRPRRPFVMRVTEDEVSDSGSDTEEFHGQSFVAVNRFSCDDVYLSDDSDYESAPESQSYLMEPVGLSEAALFELTREYRLGLQEEIRNRISMLETDLINENKTFISAFERVERYEEARKEMDKKLDTLYQRKIAEALDDHLTAVQRDHELRSQIEERKIRSDAAIEEAKRKEKALIEEKLRQEKARLEAEAKLRAEEARRAAEEAERRAVKEAVEREAAEASKRADTAAAQEGTARHQMDAKVETLTAQPKGGAEPDRKKIPKSAGKVVRAMENALVLERERLQKLKELDERNEALRLNSNKDFSSYERHVARLIRQIRGTKENVRAKATELIKIFNDPLCPQSISIVAFARKAVSYCESPDNAAFACGHVIVLVTSQVPHAMDLLLAEFHKACIYTVPKHMSYSESAFESKEAYFKALGFREVDGKLESLKDYLKQVESYMKLYGALVQTEVPGIQNLHGLKEGWAWMARLLNSLPANIYTAVALNAFLQTAGFALYKKYKSQFMKILNVVSGHFLGALKAREDQSLKQIIVQIQSYLDDKKFLQEPEGRDLQVSLLSSVMIPDSNYQDPYSHSSNRYFY